jgi:metallo-beta-lactamase family protein
MALAALEIYRKTLRDGAPDSRPDLPPDPFDLETLRLVSDPQASARLNHPGHPCVLISASGMATGGRVVHHLAALAPEPRNLILLPGFQVPGTRGRALADGCPAVKAFGRYIPVRAAVVALDEFSSHADADAILGWLRRTPRPPRTCFVVHGEAAAAATLAATIHGELGWTAVVPEPDEQVRI